MTEDGFLLQLSQNAIKITVLKINTVRTTYLLIIRRKSKESCSPHYVLGFT